MQMQILLPNNFIYSYINNITNQLYNIIIKSYIYIYIYMLLEFQINIKSDQNLSHKINYLEFVIVT